MSQPTLSEIAAKAGVSVATVSLALRGVGLVGRDTAERVKAIAEELGYRPNPLLASLATRRFRSGQSTEGTPLAIFHFSPQLDERKSPSPRKYIHEIEKEAASLGYAPTVYDLTNTDRPAPLFRELYHRMVQGIVITGSMDIHRFGRDFDWSHFSIVCCGRYHVSLPFHTVRPNIFKAVKLVFNELMARGYRRIGFAMGRHSTRMEDDEDRHGAAIALETSYLPKNRQLPVYSGLIDDSASFLAWFEKCRPDVVVGFGVSYYWHLRDKGFEIPKDLGFLSLHLLSQTDKDFCAGLDQDSLGIARQSIIFLDQLIRHRERGLPKSPLELLVPSIWNEGPSLLPHLNPP